MISCVIPTYDMAGRGVEYLFELLDSIRTQAFTDYEVIVSDDSTTPDIQVLCERLGVQWVKGKPGAAANLNNAIKHAKGEIIKPMFQDDKFMETDTLAKIEQALAGHHWLACVSHNDGPGYSAYDHAPRAHESIERLREGENTYGSPSVMAWRRNDLRFDENLKWLFDCEFYSRMAHMYGVPGFLDSPVYIRQWEGQATYTMADGSTRINDLNYVIEKYRDHGGKERQEGVAYGA